MVSFLIKTMKIKRDDLVYAYFVISFYLSLLTPYIKGYLDIWGNNISILFLIFSQGFIYVVPFGLLFLIKIKHKRLLLIPMLYFYVVFTMIFAEFFSVIDFIYGWKNYLLIFLNLFILLHLMENYSNFQDIMEKHIKIIFFISASVLLFEIVSVEFIYNSLYVFLRKLAGIEPILFGKPNGISLNIHAQGFIFSSAFFYFFIKKRYMMAIIAFICLMLALIKTWILAFFISFSVFALFSIRLKEFYYILFLLLLCLFFFVFVHPDIIEHYIFHFSLDSRPMQVMGGQLLNMVDVLINSIIPNGMIYDLNNDRLPYIIYDTEIYFLQVLFQFGLFGFLLYILILFNGIFRLRNKYWILVFLSLFTVLHTFSLQFLYIFYIAMYFNNYDVIQIKNT